MDEHQQKEMIALETAKAIRVAIKSVKERHQGVQIRFYGSIEVDGYAFHHKPEWMVE